jgi:transcription elongation factor Elf1
MKPVRKLASIHEIREALGRIQRKRRDATYEIECPLCDSPEFTFRDCSARPYAEWYVVACPHCGLDDRITVPLCPQMGGGN